MANDGVGNADAADVRDLLEPCGDVNRVTVSIVAFYDYIADV